LYRKARATFGEMSYSLITSRVTGFSWTLNSHSSVAESRQSAKSRPAIWRISALLIVRVPGYHPLLTGRTCLYA